MGELREGTTTLLFTDVEGSTHLGARSGDDAARDVLRRLEEIVRAQVAEHGGVEVKALGDGLMVAFHSARKAVACAAAVQRDLDEARKKDELPRVRIGLNAGEVIHEDGDLFGSAVSAAARICDAAAGDEVLASEVVKVLAGTVPEVTWEDRGDVSLKGFGEPARLYAAQWRKETRDTSGVTPFVGRARERAELRSWLDRLDTGRGGLVVIGGEPGVGKTRLAEEAVADAEARGFRTLTGRCFEMDSPPPYGPFVEVLEAALKEVDAQTFRMALGASAGEVAKILPQLRHLYDDIPPPLELPPQQERRYLFNSLRDFIERASSLKPLVVLFDDVHWTDEASLQLMEHIAPDLSEMPVLVIATYRDVELDAYRPLAKTLEDLHRRHLVTRMSLDRFGEDAVAAMLTKLAGEPPPETLTASIYKETEGNAFFVEEVFRHLDEEGRLRDEDGRWRPGLAVGDLDVPEGVRLVIGRRLQRLGAETTKVLTAAAVVGRICDFRLLEAVAGGNDGEALLDSLDEAQRGHVVMSRADGRDAKVVFVHELIRQTLLGAIALPRRQRLHLRVAEAMEKVYADDLAPHAAGIAHHLYSAGAAADPVKTQEYLLMAGDRAMEGAAFAEALKYFEEACELGAPQPDVERAGLLFRVGLARRSLGHLDEGLAAWRDALALYEAAGDLESVGAVAPEIALQLAWAVRWPDALEVAMRGLAAIGDARTYDRARLHGIAGVVLGWAGDYDGAVAMIDQAEELAEELHDELLAGEFLAVKTAHHFAYLECNLARATGERALGLLEGSAGAWNYVSAAAFTGLALYFTGDLARASEVAAEALTTGQQLGHFAGQLFGERVRFFAGTCTGAVGPEAFIEFSESDAALCRAAGLPLEAYSASFRATGEWRLGNHEEALRLADEAAASEPPSALWGFAQGFRFLVHATVGDRDDALAFARDLESLLPQTGKAKTHGLWSVLQYLVEGYAVLGVTRDDRALYDGLLQLLDQGAVIRFDGASIEMLAGLAAAGGGWDDLAVEHFERALEQTERLGLRTAHLDTAMYYGEMLLRRGGETAVTRATALLDAAAQGFRDLGWPSYEARVAALRQGG